MDYRQSAAYGRAIAQQLRAEVAAAGLTITSLAHRARIPQRSLDRWVKGQRPLTPATLYQVCAGIPIDPHTLIDRATVRFHEEASAPTRRA